MSPYRERAIDIYERRLRGQNWKDIATDFDVTHGRAQQIVREHEEWLAGHIRVRKAAGQPLEAIAYDLARDLPPTRALRELRKVSDAERLRMQRWWLHRYTLEELIELGHEIGWC
jgi:hypothetical protein